ncbi:hypothetical protein BGX26_000263 [Mortierella sp. AD094]|nr:hypothetical protein BGX26_000263 [Mortierella sp. AD094]
MQNQDYRQTQNQDYHLVQRQDYKKWKEKYVEAKRLNQDLIDNVQELSRKLDEQGRNLEAQNLLRATLKSQSMAAEIDRLRHNNDRLAQQNDDLRAKCNKNYMDLIRNIQVTDDDYSTIFQRLTQIRTMIENLIQEARHSAGMNREAAIDHFKSSGLLDGFPVPEADLEQYHLDFYMESAIMSTLVEKFFARPLECIYDMYKGLNGVTEWMDTRDGKVATIWRQQLCAVASQYPAAKSRKEVEVIKVAADLTVLVAKVYSNVDMWAKLNELCTNASDLSIAMFGMESQIYPIPILLDAPFDDETMNTPQRSNPNGKVSLVIFPAFKDSDSVFSMPPKVWCL